MNKSTLISTINGYLTALITQAKVRLASLELINVLFSPIVNNTKSSTSLTPLSITTPLNEDIDYILNFKKEGNKVFVNGMISNRSTFNTISGQGVCTITGTDYIGKTGLTQTVDGKFFNGDGCTVIFYQNLFFIELRSSIPPFGQVSINGFYFTND